MRSDLARVFNELRLGGRVFHVDENAADGDGADDDGDDDDDDGSGDNDVTSNVLSRNGALRLYRRAFFYRR